MNWLTLTLITVILWGVWGFFIKLSTKYMDWKTFMVFSGIGIIVVNVAIFLYFKPDITIKENGFYYAALAGIIASIAAVPYYLALEIGKASIVTALAATYPIVTVLLSLLILHEEITLVQIVGIVLALIATVLVSL